MWPGMVRIAAALVALSMSTEAGRPTRPNIMFMLVDDMGYNDVEYHNAGLGPGWTKTPNINRLASQGVRLDHHCELAMSPLSIPR